METLISIIVPVYNVAPYLEECLNSLCQQTYKQLEILLIDDGSSDGSQMICDRWAEKDNRIRVIHQLNSGVSAARNRGLQSCIGEWIGFVDADDWCELDMYRRLHACAVEQDADAVLCGYMDYPYGFKKPVPKGCMPQAICTFKDAVFPIMRRNGYFTAIWNKLFRREAIFKRNGPLLMDEVLSFGEDEVWLFEVLRDCQKIAFVPSALYHWRPRNNSLSRCDKISDKQMSLLQAKKKSISLVPPDEKLLRLMKEKAFNSCYSLKVTAYCTKDKEKYEIISEVLRPWKKAWLQSTDLRLLRKLKLLLLEVEMGLKAPKLMVERTNDLHSL